MNINAIISIDQKIADWITNKLSFNGWEIGNLILVVFALALTVVLCGIVGYEREKRGRSAGLRTHLLIGITACIVMIISIYGFPQTENNRDIARLAAQVVSGVGFLGAGAIIHNQGSIKGLTTASTIWFTMAIGLACGSFNFILAIASTGIILLVLYFFKKIEIKLSKNKPMLCVVAPVDINIMSIILGIAENRKLHIIEGTSEILKKDEKNSSIQVVFKVCNYKNTEFDVQGFIDEVKEKTNAFSVNILNHH